MPPPFVSPGRVPSAPNESWVRGKILSLRPDPTSFRGEGSDCRVAVDSVEDVPGSRNFARDRVGSVIDLYVPSVSPGLTLSAGDTFRARISLQGDECSHRFVVVGDLRKS